MHLITPSFRNLAPLALSAFVLLTVPAVLASSALQPLADSAKKVAPLPLSTSFEKGTPGENGGPYALKLKNTSDSALTVSATIIWSVASHNRAKTINLPPHEIAAGESWAIDDLAAEDRVILSADNFEKLEVKVPPGK
jgi:hypothetical protein